MTLSRLLKLQWSYIAIGVLFNVINYAAAALGAVPLSTTDPKVGVIAMAAYSLYLIPAYMGRVKLYRALMIPAILIYGSGGVLIHFVKYADDPSLYSSLVSMILAAGINIFGVSLALIALAGKFFEPKEIDNL